MAAFDDGFLPEGRNIGNLDHADLTDVAYRPGKPMREKIIAILHILLGFVGLLLPTVVHPMQINKEDFWPFIGILTALCLPPICLGLGVAISPRIFGKIAIFVHRGFIALTFGAILYLLSGMFLSEGRGWLVLIVTVAMTFVSLLSALTLFLLRNRKPRAQI